MNLNFLWIVFIIIVILEMYWRNKKARKSQMQDNPDKETRAKEAHTEINLDVQPDMPIPFGYKCQWMAVRSADTEGIVDKLCLSDIRKANWKTGMNAAYQELIFVSPPVNDWTFIIGASLPDLSEDHSAPNSITSQVVSLSKAFGEAQYFGNHRIVGYYAWMKAIDGEVIRVFAYSGERGEILENGGSPTEEEQALHIVYTEQDTEATEEDARFPNEEDVLSIAMAWGGDPMMKGESYSPGSGYVGHLKP